MVEMPGLREKLPDSHGLAGRTPLEVMAACSQGKATSVGGFSNRFTLVGSATSWHAALLGEYMLEHMARIPVEAQYASEFRYRTPLARPGDVLVVISNSGETTDAVESLRQLRSGDASRSVLTVGITNKASSTIGRECDFVIDVGAGDEVGTTSTKAFNATGFAFALLAVALAEACGTMGAAERASFLKCLEELPGNVQEVLDRESKPLRQEGTEARSLEIGECVLWDIGCQNVLSQNFIFLGRGFNFPIALEGAMKVKELAYIHAEGYPAAEMKHGPIALIDQFMPVVVVCPRADPTYEKIKANMEEVQARHGPTIAITEVTNDELEELCEYVIRVPQTHEYLMPLLAVIPLQLLAYMMGILRGNSVDNPRGLRKSVSAAVVERRGGYASKTSE
eukprot:TRINITY_DN6704_c0_g1_i1.p1 TRINITY_DN6704_c0_g1~~TRINITY_DN6704_c0_g1_i1.p1  ORF type:complete len:454 (+),score=79.38 TRINITY_DN6704_c0_g1_i1:179-1363(+)